MKKMDEDKDGKVSFEDFEVVSCNLHVFHKLIFFPPYKVTVKNDPLMLEAFGPCLPTLKVIFFMQAALHSNICDAFSVRQENFSLKYQADDRKKSTLNMI